jgi:putative FmdB family regulatory protein
LPVYEYRCAKGHDYEKTEGFSAPTQQRCTVCGARARRVISMPSVIFKGGGFYSTDNRRSSGASAAAESPPSTGDSAPKSDNGHGHSHDDGGHAHDKPAKPVTASKGEASVD